MLVSGQSVLVLVNVEKKTTCEPNAGKRRDILFHLFFAGENVFGRYIDSGIDLQRRDSEQVPAYNSVDHDTSAYMDQGNLFCLKTEMSPQSTSC